MAVSYTLPTVETLKTIDWIIEDFENVLTEGAPYYDEENISDPTDVRHPSGSVSWWGIKLERRGDHYVYYIACRSTDPPIFFRDGVRCKFSIFLGTEGQPEFRKVAEDLRIFSPAAERWQLGVLISVDDLLHHHHELIQGGQLRVRVNLAVFEVAGVEAESFASVKSHPTWDALYGDTDFADVTFYCGSAVFKAHKNVLSCGSPVLRKMFMTDMSEAATGMAQVNDLDPWTLQFILCYIYTGKVSELDPDLSLSVIYGAEKYGLDELKFYCFAKLLECLSEENAGVLAVAAYLYRAQPKVVKTIRDHLKRYDIQSEYY